jgi:YegS/Rv2252/BmrU family lipid kinase
MKHLFIINPAAGKYDHTKEYSAVIDRICGKNGLEYEIAVTAAAGDDAKIARRAAERGEEIRIYACGGDGTLNGVVNGVVGYENAAVTHFPGGTGNDTIRVFNDTEAFHHLERLLDCEETRFDVIQVNERYSLNIVSMGFDARVAAGVVAYKHLPLLSGHGAYVLSAGVNAVKGLSRHFSVQLDGQETVSAEQTLICICNCRWYGGGFCPVPEAMPDDGLLDVLTVKKISLVHFAKMLPIYKRGGYKELSEFITHARVKSLTIESDAQSIINLDGEIITAKRAEIRVVPQAIRFFYPKGLSYAAE